jgi:hypothetical protein
VTAFIQQSIAVDRAAKERQLAEKECQIRFQRRCDSAGGATAPATKYKNVRRGSFIGPALLNLIMARHLSNCDQSEKIRSVAQISPAVDLEH